MYYSPLFCCLSSVNITSLAHYAWQISQFLTSTGFLRTGQHFYLLFIQWSIYRYTHLILTNQISGFTSVHATFLWPGHPSTTWLSRVHTHTIYSTAVCFIHKTIHVYFLLNLINSVCTSNLNPVATFHHLWIFFFKNKQK